MRVSEARVRKLLRELMSSGSLTWSKHGDVGTFSPIEPNDVVDPSAALTDPDNDSFRPTDRAELKAAIGSMINDLSNDKVPEAYKAARDALESFIDDEESNMNMNDKKVEEAIRRAVRKMLAEAGPYRDTGMSYSGPMIGSDVKPGFIECAACEGEGYTSSGKICDVCKGKGAVPERSRKNVMMTDVGGSSFKEIAQEMGYASESGAKQAVTKALEKAQFVGSIDPNELDIMVLTAMNDYIEMLQSSGELTAADVQLMKDHPNIVSGLEGFREFLDKQLKKARKTSVSEAAEKKSGPKCPECGKNMSDKDKKEYEAEGGKGYPRICTNCAEEP